jgi:hypothetical protein
MEAQSTDRRLPWIAVAIIAWNTFDVIVHVVNGFVGIYRISGNIAATVAALVVVLAKGRPSAAYVSGVAALAVFVLNAIHADHLGQASRPARVSQRVGCSDRCTNDGWARCSQ